MSITRLAIALAVFFLATPSVAEEVGSNVQVEAAQVDAAHEALRTLMLETGIMEQAFAEFRTTRVPEMRARVEASDVRRELSEAGRAALDAYMESLPAYFEQEVRAGAIELVGVTAEPTAHIFSVAEWEGLTAFLRQPEARSLLTKLARGEQSSVTTEEMDVARQFYQTPAGQAYAQRGAELNRMLFAIMEAQLPLITGRILDVSLQRLCDALGDECPSHLRDNNYAP